MSKCARCCADDTKVKETRFNNSGTWRIRRRACRACAHEFWTVEIPDAHLTFDEVSSKWMLCGTEEAQA